MIQHNAEYNIRTKLLNGEYRYKHNINENILDQRWDDDKGYAFFLNRSAVKCFKGFGLPPTLTWAERGKLAELSTYLQRDTNMLYYRSDRVVKPMDIERIASIIDVSVRGAYRFVHKMMDEGVMGKCILQMGDESITQYYINPIYFFAGHYLSPSLYLLFRKDLDRYLPSWVIGKMAQVIRGKG